MDQNFTISKHLQSKHPKSSLKGASTPLKLKFPPNLNDVPFNYHQPSIFLNDVSSLLLKTKNIIQKDPPVRKL